LRRLLLGGRVDADVLEQDAVAAPADA
jgi:hypothetical protein